MVALDNTALFGTSSGRFRLPRVTPAVVIGLAALGVMMAYFAGQGFSDNGLRLGTQMVWRFNSFVFFAALVAGPLGRLVPALRTLTDSSRSLLQGFCTGIAIYLASLVLPNFVMVPDGVRHQGITSGMMAFVLFTGSVVLVMAAASSRTLCAQVGDKQCRTVLGIAAIYFWLCYALIGLSHISGPHRPDIFYGLSVSLMVLGLLVRFADRYAAVRGAVRV